MDRFQIVLINKDTDQTCTFHVNYDGKYDMAYSLGSVLLDYISKLNRR